METGQGEDDLDSALGTAGLEDEIGIFGNADD
jgi:hypothetical protein